MENSVEGNPIDVESPRRCRRRRGSSPGEGTSRKKSKTNRGAVGFVAGD
jgi:hypothetical protein